MAEQHVKLLGALGVSPEMIDEVEKLEADKVKDWKPDTIIGAVKGTMKTGFLNDPEFLKEIPEDKVPDTIKKAIETGQFNRFTNEMKEIAKKELGFEDKDFENMSKGEKESMIKALTRHISSKYYEKKGGDKALTTMQEDLRKLNESLEKKDSDWEAKMNTEIEKVNGSTGARLIKALVKSELATIEGVELTVPIAYVSDPMIAKLQSKYSLVLNSNDEIELKQKDNPKLDVIEGSKKVTFAEALKKQVLEDKVGKEKKEGGEGEDSTKKRRVTVGAAGEEGGGSDVVLPSYIQEKIDKTVAAESKDKK